MGGRERREEVKMEMKANAGKGKSKYILPQYSAWKPFSPNYHQIEKEGRRT